MATKTLIFKQLFEVIGHSNQVKFGHPMTEMDSRWMEISKNQTRLVDSYCCQHKASKYRQDFVKRHGSFAEALPRGNVVGRFSCELDHTRRDVVVQHLELPRDVQEVAVLQLAKTLCILYCFILLGFPES
jgi:hypothetical protein